MICFYGQRCHRHNRRSFELYIKFPKKRWKVISIVENLTPEDDKLWGELRQEFLEKYGADNDM